MLPEEVGIARVRTDQKKLRIYQRGAYLPSHGLKAINVSTFSSYGSKLHHTSML